LAIFHLRFLAFLQDLVEIIHVEPDGLKLLKCVLLAQGIVVKAQIAPDSLVLLQSLIVESGLLALGVLELAILAEVFQVINHQHNLRNLRYLVQLLQRAGLLLLTNFIFFVLHRIQLLLLIRYLVVQRHNLSFEPPIILYHFALYLLQLALLS